MRLFNKEKGEETMATPEPTAPVEPRRATASAAPQPAAASVIGKGLKFVGTVTGEEDLTVDGCLEGEIKTSRAIVIGAGGLVKANVHGESVTVMGRVLGNVSADQKVILKPTARVEGNIHCVSFVVNEGASFEGNINMRQPGKANSGKKPETEKTADKGDRETGGQDPS